MTMTEDTSDLTRLFEAEAAALDGDAFTAKLMARVRRGERVRRVVLVSVGMLGAALAALQLPGLYANWPGLGEAITHARVTLPTNVGSALETAPLWVLVAAAAVAGLFTLTVSEQA
jgi:hypothetical protein